MMIGILGGGQLGRMLALAGYPLGLRFRGLEPASDSALGQVAETVQAAYDDLAVLPRFAEGLELVTYEFENVPATTAEFLSRRFPVYPPPLALSVAQDRLQEKHLFERCGVPVPRFAPITEPDDIPKALEQVPLPALLKTRRLGYDGRGQIRVEQPQDLQAAWNQHDQVPCLLEERIDFHYEVSLLAARSRNGELAFYPLVENLHIEGILALSRAPAPRATPQLQKTAEHYVGYILEELQYVGLLAVEFFVVGEQLFANEIAPRVHNSGHWTIEAAETSQFEQHLRAILGWPLGACTPRGYAAMVNLLGSIPPLEAMLRVPNAHVHLYGKTPRPRRKLGHITIRADTPAERDELVEQLLTLIPFAESIRLS